MKLMLIPMFVFVLISSKAGAVENRSLFKIKPEAQECSLKREKRLLEERAAEGQKAKRNGTEVKAS